MTYKIVFVRKAVDALFAEHETYSQEFEIPYNFFEDVWYCYKKRKRYVVQKSRVQGVWATNCVGVILENDWHIDESRFDRLFKDKNEAIDWCLKQNQRRTVKVYGEKF